MSDLMTTEFVPESPMSADYSATCVAPPRVDVMALTRALVFSKETYRGVRTVISEVKPRPITERELMAQVLQSAIDASSTTSTTHSDRALTPWDLIDEDPSPTGIEFTFFQRRAREANRELAA